MSNAARSFGRKTIVALAALAPAVLLGGCDASPEQQVADQVAIAKEAADRAVAAQKAAEKAAKLARAQSGSGSFGEDEVIEEIDDSEDYTQDSSDDDGGGEVIADAGIIPPPPPPLPPPG